MSNYTPVEPLSVTVDSRMSQDVLVVSGITVSPQDSNVMATATDEFGTLYYFVIVPNVGLVEARFTAGLGSPFDLIAIEGAETAIEVSAFYDNNAGDSFVHVFWNDGQSVGHAFRKIDGEWNIDANVFDNCGSFQIIPRLPALAAFSNASMSGITPNGELVRFIVAPEGQYNSKVESGYSYNFQQETVFIATTLNSVAVFSVGPNNGFRVTGLTDTGWYGPINFDTPVKVTKLIGVQPVESNKYIGGVAHLVVFGDEQGDVYCQVLNMLGHAGPATLISSGLNILSGSVCLWANGTCRFYGTSENGVLYVASQSGFDDSSAAIWTGCLALDVGIANVNGPFPKLDQTDGTLCLLATRSDGTVDFMSQDAESQLWTKTPFHSTQADIPISTVRYRTIVEVSDANGAPCPGITLNIEPNSAISVEANGKFYSTTPGQVTSFVTDYSGSFEFSQPADGISSVIFDLSVGVSSDKVVAGQPTQIVPHGYLLALLRADPASEIYTGSTNVPLMSGATLQQAQVNGVYLAPALQDGTYQNPTQAASSFAEWLKLMAQLPAGQVPSAGFSLDLTTLGTVVVTPLNATADVQDHLLRSRRLHLGSVWDDIDGIVGDIWHAIKNAAIQIAKVIVDAENKLATFVVRIGNELVWLDGILIDDVSKVVSTIHNVFAIIGADVGKVVDWLKDIFDWSNMWSTMEVFASKFNDGFVQMQTALDQASKLAPTYFRDAKQSIDQAFGAAIETMGQTTFASSSDKITLAKKRALSSSTVPLPVVLAGSSSQRNWLASKIKTHMSADSFPTIGNPISDELWTNLNDALNGVVNDYRTSFDALQKLVLDITNPQQVWETCVADLLQAVQGIFDAIIDTIDALVIAALAVAQLVLDAGKALFSTPLNEIPVVSWLWANVLRPSGKSDAMTLTSLFGLALAVPATIISEITTSGNVFAGGGDLAENDVETVFNTALEILCPILCVVDIVNDAVSGLSNNSTSKAAIAGVNISDFVTNCVVQAFSMPLSGEKWLWAPWATCFIPLMVDLFSSISAVHGAQGNDISEASLLCTMGDSVGGFIAVITGVFTAFLNNASLEEYISVIAGPLPWATQPLILPEAMEASGDLSLTVQFVVDAIGDVGWMVVQDAQVRSGAV